MSFRRAIAVLGISTVFISLFFPPNIEIGRVLSLFGLYSVLYPIVRGLKSSDYHISVVFFFLSTYLFIFFGYFWLGKHVNYYHECEKLSNVYLALQISSLFHGILLYFIKFSKCGSAHSALLKERNKNAFYFLIIISILFTTFGQTGQSIFSSGGYLTTSSEKSMSTIFSYAVIPLSLSFIFADTHFRVRLSYISIAYFCIKDFAFGGRVDSIQLLLILFFIRFQYLWSLRKVLLLTAAGALFMVAWGIFRADVDMRIADILVRAASEFFSRDSSIDYQVGNASEVVYASCRIVYFIEEGILSIGDRVYSFLCFLLSAILPASSLPDLANLSAYLQDEYYSGGGGLAPVFFYAFGGWVGVIAFSVLIVHCMNLFISDKTNRYIHYYAILLFATTPRWYAYYPIQIIKFCVVGALLYYFLCRYKIRTAARSEI